MRYSKTYCKIPEILLSVVLFVAVLCGILYCRAAGSVTVSLMRGTVFCTVSIVRLLYAAMLPFLFVILTQLLRTPKLLVAVSFFEIFSFSLHIAALQQIFHSAAWLIGIALMGVKAISVFLLLKFSFRHYRGFQLKSWNEIFFSLILIASVCFFDYYFILPFLMVLMN